MPDRKQEEYWQKTRYRGPTHPVVEAYVKPKLDLIESVFRLDGLSVLDVGCGPGLFSHYLEKRAGRVVGTDVSPSMLDRVNSIEVVRADAGDLPFLDQSFDVAFEANLLHHVDRPGAVVSEMARVARRAVIIIEVNVLNPVMLAYSLVNPAERGGLRSSRRFLKELLRSAGLSIEAFWTTGMISQNHTPLFLVPWLRIFDFDFPFGEYHVALGMKIDRGSHQ